MIDVMKNTFTLVINKGKIIKLNNNLSFSHGGNNL